MTRTELPERTDRSLQMLKKVPGWLRLTMLYIGYIIGSIRKALRESR
jgi:hypothetical protein